MRTNHCTTPNSDGANPRTWRTPILRTATSALVVILGACAGQNGAAQKHGAAGTFNSVRPLLETNCVHCHGTARLAGMPSFSDTKALAALIGPRGYIVPGKPDASRFYKVVTLSDNEAGAMPPTGHAVANADLTRLRAWIAAGAKLPEGEPVMLIARGIPPRSR